MKTAYEQGIEWRSCPEALELRKNYASQAEWYKACNRGDWLLWQLKKLDPETLKQVLPKIKLAIGQIVDRAVRDHTLNYAIPEVKKWAEYWLNGTDRSMASAEKIAVWAARTVSAAAWATWAAWAAEATCAAVGEVEWAVDMAWSAREAGEVEWAADRAARGAEDRKGYYEELRLQANDIHTVIPEWLGKGDIR